MLLQPLAPPVISIEDPDDPDARACLEAYYAELAARFSEGFDPQHYPTSSGDMQPPGGYLYVMRTAGEAIACAALVLAGNGTCEIRRMWVAPAARGHGVARHLLHHIEDDARKLGMPAIRLDTNRALFEAQRLYRYTGYNEIARFNDNPYAHHWFEKKL
jgi:GNAT superfamily N-acetyltransferase